MQIITGSSHAMPKDPTDVASDEQNCAGDQAGHHHCFGRHTVVSHGIHSRCLHVELQWYMCSI